MGDPIVVPRLPRPVPGLVQQPAQTSAGGDRLAGIRRRHEAGRRAGQGRRAELGRRYVDDVGFLLDVLDQAAVLVRRAEGVRDFALAEAGQATVTVDQLEDRLAVAEAEVERLRAGIEGLRDECTAALDAAAEQQFRTEFDRGYGTAVRFIRHRLGTLAGGEGR